MPPRNHEHLAALVAALRSDVLVVSRSDQSVLARSEHLDTLPDAAIRVGDRWASFCVDPLPPAAADPIPMRVGQPDRHVLVAGRVSDAVTDDGTVAIVMLESASNSKGSLLSAEFRLDEALSIVSRSPGLAAIFDSTQEAQDLEALTRAVYTPDLLPVIDRLKHGLAEPYEAKLRVFPPNSRSRHLLLEFAPGSNDDVIDVSVRDMTPALLSEITADAEAELYAQLLRDAAPWVLYEAGSGLLLCVNDGARSLIGYGCLALRRATDVVLWRDAGRRADWVTELARMRRGDAFLASWIRADGTEVGVSLSARLVSFADVQVVVMRLSATSDAGMESFADPDLASLVDGLSPFGEFFWLVDQNRVNGSPKFFRHLGTAATADADDAFATLRLRGRQLAQRWAELTRQTGAAVDELLLEDGAAVTVRVQQVAGDRIAFRGIIEPTEAPQAEEGLAERLAAIFDASPTPIVVTGPSRDQAANVILEANPAAGELFRCSASSLIGRDTVTMFGGDSAEFARVRSELARGQGRLHNLEAEIRTLSQERVPVLLNNRIFSIGGRVHGLWQLTDLRERKQQENDLIDALQRLRKAQSIAQIGDFQWNANTHEMRASAECLRILGLERKAGPLTFDLPRALKQDAVVVTAELERLAEEQEEVERSYSIEIEGVSKRVHTRGLVERHDDGSLWLVGTVQDITERFEADQRQREIEAKFQETQRLESLGMLAGGVAHDFNNLLVGIAGNADLALAEPELPAYARERMEDVLRASRRAADLTSQLLAYSGKGRFVVEPHDLNELVRDISQLLEVTTSKNSMLRYQLDDRIPAVDCDVTQIRQVMLNLMVNASEAILDRRGVVTISTGVQDCTREYLRSSHIHQDVPPGRYVYFEVTDTGKGMDAETIAQVFEPFFSTKSTGRGLGLSAVLGIIKGHRGTLKVYSEVGRGTNMKVLLPAVDAAPVRVTKATPEHSWVGEGTILVIDDELAVRDLAKRILEPRGFVVLTAKDGEEGVEVFRAMQNDVRLVIVDLTMPRMNGEECFWELRQIKPTIKVILVSGYNEQEATSRFVGRGLSDFVAKPFVASDLLNAVSRALVEA